ncbi:MAG: hypothetical protein JO045_11345 [Mycobacterium sp.]|nr:hypothetical protein [Mycobacterium sp.]
MSAEVGPFVGSVVSLDRAVLTARARISIAAQAIDARSLQAREGAHLLLCAVDVDLSDSEFVRPSIVAGLRTAERFVRDKPSKPETPGKPETPSEPDTPSEPLGWRSAVGGADLFEGVEGVFGDAKEFRDELKMWLSTVSPECRLKSLERAMPGELILSDVVLDECRFTGAHGLDKLRIAADCTFHKTHDASSRDAFKWPRVVTSRRILYEEIAWRRDPGSPKLLAGEIAGIYRDLRKGLEDVKNEPEAADFYYGEMEMRRLAGRARGEGLHGRGPAPSSVMERMLLSAYWAVSGYGLRAWRATSLLVISIAAAALLFSHVGLATQTVPDQIAFISPKNGAVEYVDAQARSPGFLTALNFSARETVSLLHADSASVEPRGAGILVDFFLRLAGPVLLAFIVLALRARTKR